MVKEVEEVIPEKYEDLDLYSKILIAIDKQISGPEKSDLKTKFEEELESRLESEKKIYHYAMNGNYSSPGLRQMTGDCVEKSLLILLNASILLVIKRLMKKNKDYDLETAERKMAKIIESQVISSLIKKIRAATENDCIEQDDVSADMEVIVNTDKIKNLG